jgi:mannose-6-phosphate isomerase-like protein (cupin superfamily)
MSATIHGPGEGENFAVGASSISIKTNSEDSGGSLFLSETTIEPGFAGPPLHIHHELHDMFYVLDGTLTVQVGEDRREAGPGSFVCVRPETPHTFANLSGEPVRFLNFSTPAGFEQYMRELGAAFADATEPPAPEQLGAIASSYDVEVVGPPLSA